MVTESPDDTGFPATESRVIDRQELLQRCMGNPEFAERCLTRFLQRLQADVEQLQQSVRLGATDEISRIAHLIKGSAATVAASSLSDAAGRLEVVARQFAGDEQELTRAEDGFLLEVGQFITAVSRGDVVS